MAQLIGTDISSGRRAIVFVFLVLILANGFRVISAGNSVDRSAGSPIAHHNGAASNFPDTRVSIRPELPEEIISAVRSRDDAESTSRVDPGGGFKDAVFGGLLRPINTCPVPVPSEHGKDDSVLSSDGTDNMRPNIFDTEIRGVGDYEKPEEDWEISGEENGSKKVKKNCAKDGGEKTITSEDLPQKDVHNVESAESKFTMDKSRDDISMDTTEVEDEKHNDKEEIATLEHNVQYGPMLPPSALFGNITMDRFYRWDHPSGGQEMKETIENQMDGVKKANQIELNKRELVSKEQVSRNEPNALLEKAAEFCNCGGGDGKENLNARGSVATKSKSGTTKKKNDTRTTNSNYESMISEEKCGCDERKEDYKKYKDKNVTPKITRKTISEIGLQLDEESGKVERDLEQWRKETSQKYEQNAGTSRQFKLPGRVETRKFREPTSVSETNVTDRERQKRYSRNEYEDEKKGGMEMEINEQDQADEVSRRRTVALNEDVEGRESSDREEELFKSDQSEDVGAENEPMSRERYPTNDNQPELVDDSRSARVKTAGGNDFDPIDYEESVHGPKSGQEEAPKKEADKTIKEQQDTDMVTLPEHTTRHMSIPEETEHDQQHKHPTQRTDEPHRAELPPFPTLQGCHDKSVTCLPGNGPAKTPWDGGEGKGEDAGAEYEDALNGKLADKIVEVIMAKVHKSKHLEGELKLCTGPDFAQFQKSVPITDADAECGGTNTLTKIKEEVMREIAKAIDKLPLGGAGACIKLTSDLEKYLEWLLLDQAEQNGAGRTLVQKTVQFGGRRKSRKGHAHRFLFPGQRYPKSDLENLDEDLDLIGSQHKWWKHKYGDNNEMNWNDHTPADI